MAQSFLLENSMQSTVNFSTVENGQFFIYNSQVCLKFTDGNNLNYAIINVGTSGKLDAKDQVCLPSSVLLKLE